MALSGIAKRSNHVLRLLTAQAISKATAVLPTCFSPQITEIPSAGMTFRTNQVGAVRSSNVNSISLADLNCDRCGASKLSASDFGRMRANCLLYERDGRKPLTVNPNTLKG